MSTSPAPSQGDILRNGPLVRLLIGQAISVLGDGLTYLTLIIMLNRLLGQSGAEAAIGFLLICQTAPRVVFGLLSGVYVDRLDRKQLMIITDVARGLIILTCLLVQRPDDVWIYYVSAVLLSALSSIFAPAKNASLPHLVKKEHLLMANTLSQTSFFIALTAGSALAGILIGTANSAAPAILIDALSFFISALFIASLPLPHEPVARLHTSAAHVWGELKEGLQFVVRQRTLVGSMLGFALVMLGAGAINVLFVPFLVNDLRMSETYLGFIDLTQALGMTAANVFVARLASRYSAAQIFGVGIVGLGVSVAVVGWVEAAWVLFPLAMLWGLFIAPVQASATTIVQSVPDHIRGRTSSATETVIGVANVVSMALAGAAGSALGIRSTFIAGGLIAALGGLVAWWLMRAVSAHPDQSTPELASRPVEASARPEAAHDDPDA